MGHRAGLKARLVDALYRGIIQIAFPRAFRHFRVKNASGFGVDFNLELSSVRLETRLRRLRFARSLSGNWVCKTDR